MDLSQMIRGSGPAGGGSQNDDHLEKVVEGMETVLNTREFLYYGYYSRIKAKIRQHWEPIIKSKITRLLKQGRHVASTQSRVTQIIILLDEGGELIKVQVVGASGIEDLDQAAVEAFRAAAPFPNPPRGMIEEDGKIRIRWDFILEA
jgi:protein TonB